MDECTDRRRSGHRIWQPYVKGKLCTLANWTSKDQYRYNGQQMEQTHSPSVGREHLSVVEGARDEEQKQDTSEQTDVANSCDHECLHAACGVVLALRLVLRHRTGFLQIMPETYESVAAHSNDFPANESH